MFPWLPSMQLAFESAGCGLLLQPMAQRSIHNRCANTASGLCRGKARPIVQSARARRLRC